MLFGALYDLFVEPRTQGKQGYLLALGLDNLAESQHDLHLNSAVATRLLRADVFLEHRGDLRIYRVRW